MSIKYHRIKEVLSEKNMSQYRLAKKTDLTYNAVNAICNHKAVPRLDTLYRIAAALEVDACSLLVAVNPENKE